MIGEKSVTVTSGIVSTITHANLTCGIRWMLVYGGLVGAGESPYKANCYSSALQSIELEPGNNYITVLLTTPLD
jgi:hypothetical protein